MLQQHFYSTKKQYGLFKPTKFSVQFTFASSYLQLPFLHFVFHCFCRKPSYFLAKTLFSYASKAQPYNYQ